MKKLTLLLLAVCVMVAIAALSVSAADTASYTASYGTPKIDGVIDEVWDLSPWESITKKAANNKMSVRFKVLHDDKKIYVLAEAKDPAPSTGKKECVWFNLHSHTCSNPNICTTFTQQFMIVGGTIWDNKTGANAPKDNYRVTSTPTATGTTYIMEWSYQPANAIPGDSKTAFGLDFLVDDYTATNGWIGEQQTWSAPNDISIHKVETFGKLYFRTQAETDALGGAYFYNDVAKTDAAYDAIRYTSEKGIFVAPSASNPSFNPNTKLSRAQFVTILGRLAGADVSGYTSTAFTDVNFTRDAWFAKYAEWARVNGIVVGTQFMANKEISVAEAVLMLQRYANKIDAKDVSNGASIADYSDASTVPSWAKQAMQWAAMYDLYPFSGKALTPNKTMTRAMTAMLVYNYDIATTDGSLKIQLKAPPSGINWDEEVAINALEFGFVNDGKTPNDGIMAYYIKHYAETIPLEFPAGTYVFEYQIDFPSTVFIELSPRAELLLVSDTIQDYFITLQKDMKDWGDWDEYAQQAYIRGGTINANYRAKVGIGLHGGMHTNFEDFKLVSVLEKGIQTEIGTGVKNGCYTFNNIYFYNDKAVPGVIAIYDNSPDNSYFKCTAVNFQTFIYTSNGMFTQCSGWFNSYGTSLVKDSVYAIVTGGGQQSVFYNPMVDTYRYGFHVTGGASTSINDLVWITNKTFYTDEMRAQYPMRVFTTDSADVRIMVNGLSLWANTSHFDFADRELPKSVFLNVRYQSGWDPAKTMAYFRDDTAKLLKTISLY